MPSIPILMPQLGESIAEATVVRVLKPTGTEVKADEEIFEVETNKATMTVIAPVPGQIEMIAAEVGTSYAVGARLAMLQVSEESALTLGITHTPTLPQSSTQTSNREERCGALSD
jgi:pyruvate/2-oxoglutarate dehydrogenase complex dihydrolipoamide acyltransferase (E2) component